MEDKNQWQLKADLVRKWCLIATTEAGSGHPTSCMSAADLTTVLFDKFFLYDLSNPLNPDNDRFILSKGHAAPLLYTLFSVAGAFPLKELITLRKHDSRLEGHPTPRFPYAEAATGSLGQGLSVGAGMALIAKRENRKFKTFVLLGDGELAEGQVWEAANFASFHRLDNLVAILDINRLGQSDETMFGYNTYEYAERFTAFGFDTIVINGHNFIEIEKAFNWALNQSSGKPIAIVAKTIKGKGVSYLENEISWHGKALTKVELKKALEVLSITDDFLQFSLKKPIATGNLGILKKTNISPIDINSEKNHATREVFGQSLAEIGRGNELIYVIDGDVKNSTFSVVFLKSFPDRFIEAYIAEQNMVSVAAGLSRLGKIPVVVTFGAFFTRSADQIRMARVSESNIKFIGSHVGVSIGEDGPSQMALEDISLFGSLPDIVILQPADAVSTVSLTQLMMSHNGFVYMRTLRPKTPILYHHDEQFIIGGSKILKQSSQDKLTIAATGITVFEALMAYEKLKDQDILIRIVDGYCICPVDTDTLITCLNSTELRVLICVEDHFIHGGYGDFVQSALQKHNVQISKLGVDAIAQSGTMEETMEAAGISAAHIVKEVKTFLKN